MTWNDVRVTSSVKHKNKKPIGRLVSRIAQFHMLLGE